MTPLLGRSLGLASPEGFFGPTKNVGPQNDTAKKTHRQDAGTTGQAALKVKVTPLLASLAPMVTLTGSDTPYFSCQAVRV